MDWPLVLITKLHHPAYQLFVVVQREEHSPVPINPNKTSVGAWNHKLLCKKYKFSLNVSKVHLKVVEHKRQG
jgi:hypothetical protein